MSSVPSPKQNTWPHLVRSSVSFDFSLSVGCSHVGSSCQELQPLPRVHVSCDRTACDANLVPNMVQKDNLPSSQPQSSGLALKKSAASSNIPGITHSTLDCTACFDIQTVMCQTDCPPTSNPRIIATGLSSWLCFGWSIFS